MDAPPGPSRGGLSSNSCCCDPLNRHSAPITKHLRLVSPVENLPDYLDKWLCSKCIKSLKTEEGRTKRCFDPFNSHKKVVTKFLVCIGETDQLPLHLGKWSCPHCLRKLKQGSVAVAVPPTGEAVSDQEVAENVLEDHDQEQQSVDEGEEKSIEGEKSVVTAVPLNEQPTMEPDHHMAEFDQDQEVDQAHENVGEGGDDRIKEEMSEPICSFSTQPNSPGCSGNFSTFSSLDHSVRRALHFCFDREIEMNEVICEAHYNFAFGSFEFAKEENFPENVCSNPLNTHFKSVNAWCTKITLYSAVKAQAKGITLLLNAPLCMNCRNIIEKKPFLGTTCTPSSSLPSSQPENIVLSGASDHVKNLSPAIIRLELNSGLNHLGLEPVSEDIKALPNARKVEYVKRKLEDISHSAAKRLCTSLNVDERSIHAEKEESKTMADEYNSLLIKVKEKLSKADRKTKIQLLTLCPSSWSTNFASNFFNASRYLIKRAKELALKLGILAIPTYTPRRYVTEEMRQTCIDFYCNDQYSRIMPGMKDCVSIGGGVQMQKRLVLSNLIELYIEFKKEHPEIAKRIGKSVFVSLRPKWCVIAGSAGTHNVCVCETHQNAKLMLTALGMDKHLREILQLAVCKSDKRECMLSVCTKCPSTEEISGKLTATIKETRKKAIEEEDDECFDEYFSEYLKEQVEYKQWDSTDRDSLATNVCQVSELIDIFASRLKRLVRHDYITQQQALYIKQQKENLDESKAIILMDFSMNYTSVVQDATQKFHWSKKGVTVHPLVIYCKDEEGKLVHKSMCFFTDDVKHDVTQVRLYQKEAILFIKNNFPLVTEVLYVTDGCAAQYKCCTSFTNLCQHETMYGIKASWCFFATSHGKSACDGIGGNVKRETVKESLRRPLKNQILNAQQVYAFCATDSNLNKKISFFLIKKEVIEQEREWEKNLNAVTIPGTRSYHHFTPVPGSTSLVECRLTSFDSDAALIHDLLPQLNLSNNVMDYNGSFVAVMVETKIFIALVSDSNNDEQEAELSLLEPPLPATNYSFSENLLSYVAPFTDIICTVALVERNNTYELQMSKILHIRQLAKEKRKNPCINKCIIKFH